MTSPKGEPIWIACEGSGCPFTSMNTCTMCGQHVAHDGDVTSHHERDDIIARIERGDFS